MLPSYTLPLSDPSAILELVGGKGASLARLCQAGLPVPGGFHVTTAAYQQFISDNDLQSHILSAVQQVQPDDPATFESASKSIIDLFLSERCSPPAAVSEQVLAAYASLPGDNPAVAVRSSATAEDLPGLSFAGQQDTYLNIRGSEAVLNALKSCWASLWTSRAIGYRLQHQIASDSISLAVVVQMLVPAEAAGVMFTANPANGKRDQIMITAGWGLGEAVVGGLVTPDTLIVDKPSRRLISRQTASKELQTVLLENGTEEQPLPPDRRDAPVLSDSQVEELAGLGVQIETLYSMPMDIEWAVAAGKIAILQARPITTLPEPRIELPTAWVLPDPKGAYGRASIIEQMPEPLTPLFSSLAGPIIEEETRRMFIWFTGAKDWKTTLFVTINDYGYLNMNLGRWMMARMVIGSFVKMLPILKSSEDRWQRARQQYLEVIQNWQSRPLANYSAVELLTGVRQLTREAVRLYTVLQSGLIPAAQTSEIFFTQIYNRLIKKKGDPAAPVFVMGFQSTPIQAELALYDLAMWARSRESLAAHLTATSAGQLALEIEDTSAATYGNPDDWREWQQRFQAHLAKYGHSTYDMDFSKAVAADDPTPLLETLRMYLLGRAANPYIRLQNLAENRQLAAQSIIKRLPGPIGRIFLKQLQRAQKYAPLREDGFADLGLGYPLLRQMLRQLGRRLVQSAMVEQPDDVFWLYEQELDQATLQLDQRKSVEVITEAICQRKAEWCAKQQLTPPMVLPQGTKFLGLDIEKMTPMGFNSDSAIIKGFGASQGKVTAPARVIHGPQDFNQMQFGEVLVAPITTPAWTPLFALASAIVTDIGGPLSHSSIVAREYGIPAVLGTGVATHFIQSGQMITVDGSAGTVSLINQV